MAGLAPGRAAETGISRAIVVMGVSGCGKSTLAAALARALGYAFVEGDGLHSAASIAKMAAAVPLEDEDRWPWLDRVGDALARGAAQAGVVLSCSALRRTYRDRIRAACGIDVRFVHPFADRQVLLARMQRRSDHYMPLALLDSQLALLEMPDAGERAIPIDATLAPDRQVVAALRALSSAPRR